MLCYIYDGSFDGLLTAIYEAYYRKEVPERILFAEDYQENFLDEKIYIHTDTEKARRVYESIRSKISKRALENIFYTYLSELEDTGIWIYQYLKLGWKMGGGIDDNIADDRVLKIHETRLSIDRERHLMLGLVRFGCLEGNIYYAPIEPKFNIVGLIAPHFVNRLSDQSWIIHDVKRGIGAVYNGEDWIIRDIDINNELRFDKDEFDYQKLWKEYFKTIAIKNRINPKLQKRNMPMRYWRYLVEKG